MFKFLNRPLVALAAGLAVIFVIILIRSYVTLLDDLTTSVVQDNVSDDEYVQNFKATSYVYGPQLPPTPSLHSNQYSKKPVINTPITLG